MTRQVTIRRLVRTILLLLTLSFWINLFILIEWSKLVENNNADVNRCNQKNLCRYRYPITREPKDYSSITAGPGWNTTAVGDDADSFGRCRCDVDCGRYSDCCADAADVYDMDARSSLTWTCLPMTTEEDRYKFDQNYYMYMIASCPTNNPFLGDESLEALCGRRKNPEFYSPHQYSYLIDIPVLSLTSNRTYANVYCAQCHSDAHQLAQWNISIKCNDSIEKYNLTRDQMFHQEYYRPGKRTWQFNQEHLTINCVLIIEQLRQPVNYLKSTAGRHCVSGSYNCATDWTSTAEGHNCDIYTLYVETSSVQVPKNPHCVDQFLHSFSIVMDFKFGGNQMGQTCRSNEIFDHLQKSCHPVTCEADFSKNSSGICLPRHQMESTSNVSLSSRCSRLTLTQNVDYYFLDNGSLVLNKTGETLRPNDYEQSQNGTVQICEKESLPRFLNELKNYLKYSYAQRCLSNVCLTISVICLAFHICIHIALPKLRNVPAKNLLALSCSLFLGQLLFLTGVGARNSIGYGPCAVIAVLIHWSLMAAFFWMNVMGFDMCRTFAGPSIAKPHLQHPSVRRRRTTFRSYSLYGWSCPTIIVFVALVVDFCDITDGGWAPQYGTHQCWMCNKNGLGLFFVLPMAVLLAVNLIFFILTAWSIVRQWREAHIVMRQSRTFQKTSGLVNLSDDHKTNGNMIFQRNRKSCIIRMRTRFFLYVKLGTIMGLGWISGFIAALADVPGLWYPFILFNTLQGTFIFLAFDCKRKIYYMVYEAITKRPHPSNLSSSQHKVSTTASTKLQTARKISLLMQPIVSNNQE